MVSMNPNDINHVKKIELPYYANDEYQASKDNDLQNKLYALICPILNAHESRGYNSHARTQAIMESVTKQMDEWIGQQR